MQELILIKTNLKNLGHSGHWYIQISPSFVRNVFFVTWGQLIDYLTSVVPSVGQASAQPPAGPRTPPRPRPRTPSPKIKDFFL